jgi:4-diphosphocytidyl-2-C-methyl-D-erythritol kinase
MKSPTRVTVRARAKINLDLRILGRRADGYHELRTVFQTLAWHDTVTVSRVQGPLTIAGDATKMPLDHSNLAWRAAEALWRAAGPRREASGARIAIVKRIPAQAGLGGGSSDAAATLVALNRLWNFRLLRAELASVARPLGADVAFFLTGGTALGLGRGDEIYPLADLPSHYVVVAWPGHGVSTVDAYRWFTEFHARRAPAAARDGHAGGWDPECLEASGNDMEAPVEAHRPEIGKVRRTLASCGARVAQMSGSGAAVFGLFESKAKAERACGAVKAAGWVGVLTRTLARGRLVV